MADRHDIDALLVDAVYREREHDLDAADRARLDAYLASHPHERTALDAMRHTRARVQEIRLGLPDAEPSGGLSALLLQEAARRAPARGRSTDRAGGVLAWLQGALRPMFAHPALASAAALVLVGGTAGALYLRGGSAFYEQTASPAVEPAVQAPEVARAEPAPGDTYAATLDELGADLRSVQGTEKNALRADGQREATGVLVGSADPALAEPSRFAAKDRAGAPAVVQMPARGRAALPRSMDVTTPEPELKSFDDEAALAFARKQTAAPAPKPTAKAAKEADADGAGEVAAVTTESASAGVAAPPPPPAAASAAPAPASAAPAPATARYDATREEERAAWARGQHQRAVAAVKRNDCNEAAALAAEIAVRAGEYYTASVADDRNLRACKPAIERARKRDAERRAKSRAPAANDAERADALK